MAANSNSETVSIDALVDRRLNSATERLTERFGDFRSQNRVREIGAHVTTQDFTQALGFGRTTEFSLGF